MPDPRLYPFTARKVTIQDHSLSFLDQGQGEAIVMLHGNPTWSFYYRNLVSLLQGNYRVIVPDHMGCGFSDKPQNYPYTLKTHIDNLETLLAERNIEKFSLVVHDWGGAIGMGLAVRYPERVQSIVILNTAAFRSRRIPLRISICRVPLLGALIVRGFNGFARAAMHMAVVNKMAPPVVQGYLEPYDSWANRVALLRFVQDIPLAPGENSWQNLLTIENNLQQFRDTPMLILWGGRDFCFNNHFYDEWLHRFPGAEHHYFPAAGHFVLEDAFEPIAPLITTFFQKHTAR
jgi:pimeloyl-ACP methyl ester carboxylesterase